MKIQLPTLNNEEQFIENRQSIILIGANGSGKTRMSIWIENNNENLNIHRISAQKSLNMPNAVSPIELELAKENLWYGGTSNDKEWLKKYGKKNNRWNNTPENHLLNDYQQLMEYLFTDNFEKSIEFREKRKKGDSKYDNITNLEQIKSVWENIITHRKLKICAGKIEVDDGESSDGYNGSDLSDGERAIFYFIGEVITSPKNSLIIIDEPENHLHHSILVRLWNAIEIVRSDCTFLYITHNLEFANSRINSEVIWVKDYINESNWNYDILDNISASDSLKLQILGNRQSIMFIEGTPDKSTDKKLYSALYPDYNIIPVDNCNLVIQYTKAYNKLSDLHYMDVIGIIDRDRRNDDSIEKYKKDKIFIPKVAEIENLFLLPEVIYAVRRKINSPDSYEDIVNNAKNKTFKFLTDDKKTQALLFTKQLCENDVYSIINRKTTTIGDYKNLIQSLPQTVSIQQYYDDMINEIDEIINNKDYIRALQIINNKGLLPHTKITASFGWKKDYYIDYVIRMLYEKDDASIKLCNNLKKYIAIF